MVDVIAVVYNRNVGPEKEESSENGVPPPP